MNNFSESVTAVSGREAVRFMADLLSNQIGAVAHHRGLTAGDGRTLALP